MKILVNEWNGIMWFRVALVSDECDFNSHDSIGPFLHHMANVTLLQVSALNYHDADLHYVWGHE